MVATQSSYWILASYRKFTTLAKIQPSELQTLRIFDFYESIVNLWFVKVYDHWKRTPVETVWPICGITTCVCLRPLTVDNPCALTPIEHLLFIYFLARVLPLRSYNPCALTTLGHLRPVHVNYSCVFDPSTYSTLARLRPCVLTTSVRNGHCAWPFYNLLSSLYDSFHFWI